MTPDDPRHGTTAGHVAHMTTKTPLCQPCKRAKLLYDKQRRLDIQRGIERTVPMWRVRRRVEGLQALGHTLSEINAAGGLPPRKLHSVLFANHQVVYASTFEGVDRAFEALSMTLGRDVRVLNNARRKGYAPPLAWDDIDDPMDTPKVTAGGSGIRMDIDPVVVERVLAGDTDLHTTPAEKREVVRRWKGSQYELAARTGWKVERYVERGDVA